MSKVAELFPQFQFENLDQPTFKEDSVREVLILPLLYALGYEQAHIVRSKALKHPVLTVGSKKRPVTLIPDYLLKVQDNYAWVLDAKSPNQNIQTGANVEQVYSYSIHPEIRTKFFALCNGRAFALFRQDEQLPILYFELAELDAYWDELSAYLSPSSFQSGKTLTYVLKTPVRKVEFDYATRPLLEEIRVKKQAAKRHFGVTAYFTRQSWNVVREYIKNFSQKDDLVLDPFGGSGITAIEAMMVGRRAIHLDINPLSVFIVDSLSAPVDIEHLQRSFDKIKATYVKNEPKTTHKINQYLKNYSYPKGYVLPKNSDVPKVEKLFSKAQLAQLAFLRYLILQEPNESIKKSLLLAFYNTVSLCNLTFHATPHGGGNHFGYYYRYRMAKIPTILDVMQVFERKFERVLAAKKEIFPNINENTIHNLKAVKQSATDLSFLNNESIDYIYTDPPYGKKIAYLDLSIIWNAWLDLPVTPADYQLEAIEGGELGKSKAEYNDLIAKSIAEMYRVLKFDRWMSFVFAHKDPEFWHLIIETAERCGFEYAGAVAQKNGQTSFKKRQNPFTVLSGQLIINFRKVRRPRYIIKAALGARIGDIILQTIEGVIAKNNGASLEQLNDELIIKGLELGFLDLMKKEYSDLTPILLDLFDYDDQTELFTLKTGRQFKTNIDLHLRVRYYLMSYLRRMDIEHTPARFDEIVLYIMPLLKNGTTPENQTILTVLEDIAIRIDADSWKLKTPGQQQFFD
ncbi:DNA methyltransferase [Thiospirillum jenense]|uniref:Type I restriction enzyme HsdR N-terminal domain-containing protein n=1 Tax=Thiospirillum jenense TaxID=1653858 RepID=A0A839H937_9GAMM|nr:DNA methyltransferase [Thiospirillum jenense]MBB1125060.1 type I restriction enzyme HsdR N-terminal domain-containing protein [Thiospirillum jenense]